MMTSRERFIRTMRFESTDVPFVKAVGGWAETGERWRQEGWDGRALHEIFGTDILMGVGVYYGPTPRFEYQLVDEDETTRVYINHEGILMREFKEYSGNSSMPQFLKFPVETEADFDKISRERLGLNFEQRAPNNWDALVANWKQRADPLMCFADRWGGFFGTLRNLMGVENLCLAFYDQPKLVEKMMAKRAEAIIAITERILADTTLDIFAFWEDMAYNSGPFIAHELYRKFAMALYKRVGAWLRSPGVEIIGPDSDGDVSRLISIGVDVGFTGVWPFEGVEG